MTNGHRPDRNRFQARRECVVPKVPCPTATTYDPKGNVTREQMAAFLARLWRAC
jgi:hypothetical protein